MSNAPRHLKLVPVDAPNDVPPELVAALQAHPKALAAVRAALAPSVKPADDHPGVEIRAPRPPKRPYVRLRWYEPNGERVERTLKHQTDPDASAVRAAARVRSRDLARRMTALAAGVAPVAPVPRGSLAQACEDFVEHLATTSSRKRKGKARVPNTIRQVEDVLNPMLVWAAKLKPAITESGEVDADFLKAWEQHARTRPDRKKLKRGITEARAGSTVDLDRKWMQQFALWLMRQRAAHPELLETEVAEILATVTPQRVEDIAWHNVRETRLTLEAAIKLDASGEYDKLTAPTVAFGYLGGMRLREIVYLKVGAVLLDAESHYDPDNTREHRIELGEAITKGSRARTLNLTDMVGDVGVALLREMCRGRAPDEWLCPFDYDELGERMRALRTFGAPGDISTKDLRASYANYLRALRHVDDDVKGEAIGNSDQVRKNNYLDRKARIPPAATLEDAMKSRHLFAKVLRRLRAYNDKHGITPHAGERTPKSRKRAHIKGAAVLE